jgi:geranylgeranyl diphosphate synthase type I
LYSKISGNTEKARDFGTAMAIIGGDSLLNMGADAIGSSDLEPKVAVQCLRYYEKAYQLLGDGVLLETNMTHERNTAPEAYLQMVRLKTAVLFENSLQMGATIARATQSQIEGLRDFGMKVGQAFQMQDDVLGSFGDESVTGKAADGDIREGKKTMLVIESYRRGSAEQKKTLDDILGKKGITERQVEQVRSVFRDSGALKATQDTMGKLLLAGQKALETSPPLTPKYKAFLIGLSSFLVERSF